MLIAAPLEQKGDVNKEQKLSNNRKNYLLK